MTRGHEVRIFEPPNAWSLMHLIEEQGRASLDRFWQFYPELDISQYELSALQLERELAGADLVLAHEWNDPELIWKLGRYRRSPV